MHPIICKIGPLNIYSYGLMFAIAVLICTFLLSREAKKYGISEEIISDLMFFCVVAGIIGARIFYILLNLDYFSKVPLEMIMIYKGGLAWQGGLIFATLTGLWYIKKKKLSLPKTLDLLAPYIALGQSIGRIGCFLNGCCFGKEVSWGLYFPVLDARVHPTQLYMSLSLFIIFLILKYFRKSAKTAGSIFILYIVLASIMRFFVEFVRGDHIKTFLGLSIYQIISLCLILISSYVYSYLKSRRRKQK